MKELCLASLKYLYPNGLEERPHQFREVIRIYCMGWIDSISHIRDVEQSLKYLNELKPMLDDNWWPDDSWKWWLNKEE